MRPKRNSIRTCVSFGLLDHYSELFTQDMYVATKFISTLTKPSQKLLISTITELACSNYIHMYMYGINNSKME